MLHIVFFHPPIGDVCCVHTLICGKDCFARMSNQSHRLICGSHVLLFMLPNHIPYSIHCGRCDVTACSPLAHHSVHFQRFDTSTSPVIHCR